MTFTWFLSNNKLDLKVMFDSTSCLFYSFVIQITALIGFKYLVNANELILIFYMFYVIWSLSVLFSCPYHAQNL
jgi:hypothetical protein